MQSGRRVNSPSVCHFRESLAKIVVPELLSLPESRSATEHTMGKINWARVLLGGFLAGLIINLFEFVANGVFLARYWEAMMKALGRTNFPSSNAAVIFLIWGFLSGIAAIWL